MALLFALLLSGYQNVSILYFIGAKDDGAVGVDWSYETSKAPVTNKQAPSFYRTNILPVAKPKVSEH